MYLASYFCFVFSFVFRESEQLKILYNDLHSFFIYLIPSLGFLMIGNYFLKEIQSIASLKFAIELRYDIRQWESSCTCYLMEIILDLFKLIPYFILLCRSGNVFLNDQPQRSTNVPTIFLPVNQLTKLQQISPRKGNLSLKA